MPRHREKRLCLRHPYRIPCTFQINGTEHRALVLDVSGHGLFIGSAARPERGTELVVTIRTDPPIQVTGRIVRWRGRHRDMASLDQPGLGVALDFAPEAYYQLVLRLEEKALADSRE